MLRDPVTRVEGPERAMLGHVKNQPTLAVLMIACASNRTVYALLV